MATPDLIKTPDGFSCTYAPHCTISVEVVKVSGQNMLFITNEAPAYRNPSNIQVKYGLIPLGDMGDAQANAQARGELEAQVGVASEYAIPDLYDLHTS